MMMLLSCNSFCCADSFPSAPRPLLFLFLVLGEEGLLEVLPEDAEQYALHAVREDLRLEAAEHEAPDAGFLDDVLNDLRVGDLGRVGLLVDLADPDGVRAGVADGRRAEPEEGP